ncbi:YbhN family protein [Effusibacillus consociatus]|uniref:Phosphatidylglycerol lysyltransferase n=1 Tax=Effusibacillus consociatus TaxID=1117041 RepID=A0ABV9Q8Z5_9BACL
MTVGLLGWFIYTRQEDLLQMPGYLQRVGFGSAAALLSLEFLFLLLVAQSNRLVYRSIGVRNRLFDQLQLLLAAGTIERLLPSAGAAGMGSYVWLARRRGIDVSDSVKMTATTFVLGYAQIVPLLLIPIFYMDTFHLPPEQSKLLIGISAGFVILVIGLAAWIGSKEMNSRIEKWAWLSRFPRVLAGIGPIHDHVRLSWRRRRKLVAPLLFLWALYPVRIAMLWVCFRAFDSTVSLPLILTGYSVTILISFLTFLPTTLGVFELTMVGTLSALGVATDLATAVTVLYRLVTYWSPIPFGLLSWWNLQRRSGA